MPAGYKRPSTSREVDFPTRNSSTMMMIDSRGNESVKVTKQKSDTDEKCDEKAKRSHLTLDEPPQVEHNSDVMVNEDSTESTLSENRLPEGNMERVIETTIFDSNETYRTTTSMGNSLRGTAYQWKHMMLVVHRAREKGWSFRFATEMDAAEKFDDVVLEYQDDARGKVHRFLQAKYGSVDEYMIKADHLIRTKTKQRKAPFGMMNYFNSWRKIKNNPMFHASRSKEFILCTNIGLDVAGLEAKSIEVEEVAMDDLLKVTVGPKKTPRFFKFVDRPSILRDSLESEAGASQVEVSEFLEEFILAVDQPNEIELGTMIKHELGGSSQFNLLDVDFIGDSFQNMMVNLLKETGRHSEFLSHQEADAFFEELERKLSSLITVGLKLSYSAKLKNYGVKFEGENRKLLEFLDSSDPLQNSIFELTSTNPTFLTALRVHQTLEQSEAYKERDSSIFISLEKLLLPDIKRVVSCAFESSISHDLLVIDCGSESNNGDARRLLNELRSISDNNPRKKMILIIQEGNISAAEFMGRDDAIGIDNLEKSSRQKLLEKSIIKFQGDDKKTSFGTILAIDDFDNIRPDELTVLKEIINPEMLIQLIRGEEIVIGHEIQGVGEVEEYYIPRTIVKHVVIKGAILNDSKIPDLFAIGGIDQKALEKLATTENGNQSLHECSPTKLDPNKYHILRNGRETDDFKIICERNSNRNIHWLQVESRKLLWQLTFGSITNLIAYKDASFDYDYNGRPGAICMTENQLAQNAEERRIVILSDTAGMGKSTILTHLAVKMKHDRSGLLVIKVDLTEHTRVLDEEKRKRSFHGGDTNGAVNFLVDKLSNLRTDFEREIFKAIIKLTGDTALLFDGYDEICPAYEVIIIELIRTLAKLRIKRLFVTTRPHTKGALERELGTFSHLLQPFSRANQMEFLTKFWGKELNSNNFDKTIEEDLKKHARAVLNILVQLIGSRMREFTGIPLQTRLVAEAIPYVEKEKLNGFDSLQKLFDITDLYKDFIAKKFDIYFRDKSSSEPTNLGQKQNKKVVYRAFLMKLQKLALEELFDEKTVIGLTKRQRETDETSSSSQDEEDEDGGEERSGMITRGIGGKLNFVHRTFAEYFVAKFLIKKLKENDGDQQVQKFFVTELLVESQYRTIRAFLNCLLCRRDHAPEKCSWEFNQTEKMDQDGQTLYHVAAEEGNAGIVRFFSIRLGKNHEDETKHNPREICNVTESRISSVEKSLKQDPDINLQNFEGELPLGIAAKNCDLGLMKCFIEGGAEINRESGNGETPLDLACRRGTELDVLQYLVENGAEINRESGTGWTPLDLACQRGVKLDVVQYLVENGAEINREAVFGGTPLHLALLADAELDVVQYLVENIAEINHETGNGLTPLHFACGGAKLDVVQYLVENGAEINRESGDGETPLHFACQGFARLDVLQYLVENGAEINYESRYRDIPLHRALLVGAKLDVVQCLVKNGADINHESGYGRTPLHLACEGVAKLDVVQYLVENGAEINPKSGYRDIPLQRPLLFYAKLDVERCLVKNGADINRESEYGKTPLHLACDVSARLDVVQYLVENGAEINRESGYGETPLHLALLANAKLDVVQYLVENRAEINREMGNGKTPLHLALGCGAKLDVVQYLVENGAEINHQSKNGSTPLHSACERGFPGVKLDAVQYLVENGAEINRESGTGWTLLDLACQRAVKLDAVRCLVENRAEINRESGNGSTPLSVARNRHCNSYYVIKYLITMGAVYRSGHED